MTRATRPAEAVALDARDRALINRMQDGLAVEERPFAAVAAALETTEEDVVVRLASLLEQGVLSRFGPMFDAERLGGAFCLCAMRVPAERLDEVAAAVNAHAEVAHNYARDDDFNLWFVLATESPERIAATAAAIEGETGLRVYAMPKLEEFYVRTRFEA